MKSLKSLHRKKTICRTKGQSLLTSAEQICRANLPFYGIIARIKSHVFTATFLAVFPLDPTFWSGQFMFYIHGFQNRNGAAQNDSSIEEYYGEYFLLRQKIKLTQLSNY